MDKKEIFDTILQVTADVCYVTVEQIMSSAKSESIVEARTASVFWLVKAGLPIDLILRFTGRGNDECINKIRRRYEELWPKSFEFRESVIEIGRRLRRISEEIGHPFALEVPIAHMNKITGR